jgi:hypothetical protein
VTPEQEDREALALYVILSRDVTDFMDMCIESDPGVLAFLYRLLTSPNPNTPEADLETNRIGASLLKGIMESRNLPIPGEPTAIEQVLNGVLQDGT